MLVAGLSSIWKNREVVSLIVSSLKGGQTEICFNGVSKKVVFKTGEKKRLFVVEK